MKRYEYSKISSEYSFVNYLSKSEYIFVEEIRR